MTLITRTLSGRCRSMKASMPKTIDASPRGAAQPRKSASRGRISLPRSAIATGTRRTTVRLTSHHQAVAALRRGYNCLLFDGPGQGRPLIHQGLHMRPNWESVVSAVLDTVLSYPNVDAQSVALAGWSFGGYLAPRAASGEHRIAA